MSNTCILEFPSNLGLKEPARGKEPGVKRLPDWLREHGFHELIAPRMVYTLNPPPYSMQLDIESGVRNADAISVYARQQADLLKKVIEKDDFALVLGGDCSILTGNALGLKELGRYGLFFLDGHTDFMLPDLSTTGGAAGMDLAIVTGHGHDKLTNISSQRPYFREEDVWCVGNREYDPAYVGAIRNSLIDYTDLATVRRDGTAACVNSFLSMVTEKDLDGFWVHVDVDVLHNELMPAVDSPDPGGISYEEFSGLLRPLLSHTKACGMELTILDPDLDPEGTVTKRFIHEFCGVFLSSRLFPEPPYFNR